MTQPRSSTVFGRRREPHTIIIARGDDIRHFTVRPWVMALVGCFFSAIAIGYLLATSYLVLRDDLIGATVARQARLQQAYEDRISALRAQVDRITSRQLLDQQLMEDKVAELLDRQRELTSRDGRLKPLLKRAGMSVSQSPLPVLAPAPTAKPEHRADAATIDSSLLARIGIGRETSAPDLSSADRADRLFVEINKVLRSIEAEQVDNIRSLTENAYQTAGAIKGALESAGLEVASDFGESMPAAPSSRSTSRPVSKRASRSSTMPSPPSTGCATPPSGSPLPIPPPGLRSPAASAPEGIRCSAPRPSTAASTSAPARAFRCVRQARVRW